MPSRNEPCPCGSKQKYKRCCLGESRPFGRTGPPPPRRPPPSGVDPVTAEAAVLAEEVMTSPHPLQRISEGMVLLRTMFQ
ncbi:SEC-C metal-binding domain-containing protein, partial [Archangium sp.]|uniref:SEC-C metal-binding domain-containing protein n=1 Tax=Archangium sp. TaxID=1872627 RepID=UPI0039C85A3B